MADIAIDLSGDFILNNGDARMISKSDELLQKVFICLRTFKGEWAFDLDRGIDWLAILKKPFSRALAVREIRRELGTLEGIRTIMELTVTPDNDSRVATIYLKYSDIYNETRELRGIFPSAL